MDAARPDDPMTARDLRLADWQPQPALVVRETLVDRPRFPVVDIHNHVGRWLSPNSEWLSGDVSELLGDLDDAGVETLVNLDGRWGDDLERNLARYDAAHRGAS